MREEQPDLVVVDVREPFEWDEGHIDGAMHLPMGEALAPQDRFRRIGRRRSSARAGCARASVISALSRAGLTDFYNVIGGMTAWRRRATRGTARWNARDRRQLRLSR